MHLRAFAACSVLLLAACSSSDDTGDPASMNPDPMDPDPMDPDPSDPDPTDPENPLDGRNGTMPCEPLNTIYLGDENCILPPEEGTGLHIHIGPNDYDDPDEVAPFLLGPEDENEEYYLINATNEEVLWFYRQHYRMRPGSHHMIINLVRQETPAPVEEGWYTRTEYNDYLEANGWSEYPIAGTQRSVSDFPPSEEIPPEDINLARPLSPRTGLAFDLHFVNTSPEPILREAWVNFMVNDTQSIEILGGLYMVGARFRIPPDASEILNYSVTLEEPERRIVSIFGHRHANTDRFTAWVHRNGGERELVYEDYDWNEPAELIYNSVVDNGTPDRASGRPGGFSGILTLHQGDVLEWECEVNNRSGVELVFANEAYTAEMCNVFGSVAGPGVPIWFAFPPRNE